MAAVFALALAAGVYLILKPLFGFLERAAAASAHFATGIAAAVFAITAVYVVGALSLYLLCSLTVQARRRAVPGALILLVAGQLLAFRAVVVFLGLQRHADDGRDSARKWNDVPS